MAKYYKCTMILCLYSFKTTIALTEKSIRGCAVDPRSAHTHNHNKKANDGDFSLSHCFSGQTHCSSFT